MARTRCAMLSHRINLLMNKKYIFIAINSKLIVRIQTANILKSRRK